MRSASGGPGRPARTVGVRRSDPGEVLAIDWGTELVAGRRAHVFCAVLARSRYRSSSSPLTSCRPPTLAMFAECFEELGGSRSSCWPTGWPA